jgi:hypothetical protein
MLTEIAIWENYLNGLMPYSNAVDFCTEMVLNECYGVVFSPPGWQDEAVGTSLAPTSNLDGETIRYIIKNSMGRSPELRLVADFPLMMNRAGVAAPVGVCGIISRTNALGFTALLLKAAVTNQGTVRPLGTQGIHLYQWLAELSVAITTAYCSDALYSKIGAGASAYGQTSALVFANATAGAVSNRLRRYAGLSHNVIKPSVWGLGLQALKQGLFGMSFRVSGGTNSVSRSIAGDVIRGTWCLASPLDYTVDSIPRLLTAELVALWTDKAMPRILATGVTPGHPGSVGLVDDDFVERQMTGARTTYFMSKSIPPTNFPPEHDQSISPNQRWSITQAMETIIGQALTNTWEWQTMAGALFDLVAAQPGRGFCYYIRTINDPFSGGDSVLPCGIFPLPNSKLNGEFFVLSMADADFSAFYRAIRVNPGLRRSLVFNDANFTFARPLQKIGAVTGMTASWFSTLSGGDVTDVENAVGSPSQETDTPVEAAVAAKNPIVVPAETRALADDDGGGE